MSLTRKALSAMGIEEAQIDEIIKLHTGVVNEIKDERDKLKADAEKLPRVQKELDEAKADLDKQNEENPYKVKYETLLAEFDEYKRDIQTKEEIAKKENAYKDILKEAGMPDRMIPKALQVSKDAIDAMELDDDGSAKDKEKIVEGIKTEWDGFLEVKTTKGAKTPTPPDNNGGVKKTKEEIMKIEDTQKRQEAYAQYLAEGGED